jgi:hypothetical protein
MMPEVGSGVTSSLSLEPESVVVSEPEFWPEFSGALLSLVDVRGASSEQPAKVDMPMMRAMEIEGRRMGFSPVIGTGSARTRYTDREGIRQGGFRVEWVVANALTILLPRARV